MEAAHRTLYPSVCFLVGGLIPRSQKMPTLTTETAPDTEQSHSRCVPYTEKPGTSTAGRTVAMNTAAAVMAWEDAIALISWSHMSSNGDVDQPRQS